MASMRSIKAKLVSMTMLSSGIALVLACGVFLVHEFFSYRTEMVRTLSTQAQIVGANSAASLVFADRQSAEQTLTALRAEPQIVAAAIYSREGRLFAAYQREERAGEPPPAEAAAVSSDHEEFAQGRLMLHRKIMLDGEVVGSVFLQSDLSEMERRGQRYLLIAGAVLALAFVVALFVSSRLQGAISGPVLHLADVASSVSRDRNYTVRAVPAGGPELETLIRTFNQMLSEIQQQDAALREAHDDLERRVEQRTAELTAIKDELESRNAEVVRATQLKSQFLAGMSHELRTPLNAVIGFTGTLLMKLAGPLTQEQERQLNTIRTSSKHLLSLINDLLDLAKIESGKAQITLEPVHCQRVLHEVESTLRPLAEQKGLQFSVWAPVEDVVVEADGRALRQILINLTNNAIKFTEFGTVAVEVRQGRDNGRVTTEFVVADTGTGVPPEAKQRLFQAFSQVEGTKREGTGLGLHISQKLAELLGGHIDFESEVGKGSRFRLVLEKGAQYAGAHSGD